MKTKTIKLNQNASTGQQKSRKQTYFNQNTTNSINPYSNISSCTHSANHVIEHLLESVSQAQKDKSIIKKSVHYLRRSIVKEEQGRFSQMLANGQNHSYHKSNNKEGYQDSHKHKQQGGQHKQNTMQDKQNINQVHKENININQHKLRSTQVQSITEQVMPTKGKQQNRRPFSGKIQKVYLPCSTITSSKNKKSRVRYRPSTYSIQGSPSTSSTKHIPSTKHIQSTKALPYQPHTSVPTSIHQNHKKNNATSKLFALHIEDQQEENAQFYSQMRKIKKIQQKERKEKEEWMKKAEKQAMEYQLMQSRFMQGIGRNNFYYSSNGQIVQPMKLTKVKKNKTKIINNIKSLKSINMGSSKKIIAPDAIYVRYAGKDTYQSSNTCKQFQIQTDITKVCGTHAKYTFINS